MIKCIKCGLPETHETIFFDKEGICSICNQHKLKKESINWNENKKNLDIIIEEYRGKNDYDCIIPFSGGKDSTWTLYYLIKEYNIKPLVVSFDHGFFRPKLLENVKKVSRNLGFDMITFTPNWKLVQRLMLLSFIEKGDFCWHCHAGIFSYPMWIAIEKKIPLIFWGEPSAEYTSYYSYDQIEEVDEKRFNRYVNLGINAEDMFIRLEGEFDMRDLKPYSYPPLNNLKKLQYKSLCLGSYIPWDTKKQSDIISRELGWEGDEVENIPSEYSYEKIECQMQGVRDYIKFIKRGYSRPSHLLALDIRNNRKTLSDKNQIVDPHEGRRPPSLDLFLSFVGLTEKEFLDIAMNHQISPNIHEPKATKKGKKTRDFDKWCKEGTLNRKDGLTQLSKWKKNCNTCL